MPDPVILQKPKEKTRLAQAEKKNQPEIQPEKSLYQNFSSFARMGGAAPPELPLTRTHTHYLQRTIGNRAIARLIQAKLQIGQPGDKYEQEADRVADMVMSMPAPVVNGGEEDEEQMVQTKPLAATITPLLQRQPEMPEEDETLQTKTASSHTPQITPKISANINAMRGNGRPLPPSTRAFFEPRFGVDFGSVRVHTNGRAAETARDVNARAFTVGSDVAFGGGEYAPESSEGKKLLAHELAHVVQQTAKIVKYENVLQRYTLYDVASQTGSSSLGWVHPDTDDINVADDGALAVGESGDDAWAEQAKITNSEAILKSTNSDIKLEKGTRAISGKAPKSGAKGVLKTLKEVKVINRIGGGRADLTADCGTTARQVLGIDDPTKRFSAAIRRGGVGVERYTTPETYYGGSPTTTEVWFEEICRKEFGTSLTPAQARARYDALSATNKDKFDRKYGINKYAKPRVGQAITIDRPSGWNFHFAGVILRSGNDYVTTENFPDVGRSSQSWYFEIYGPKSKGQTFYEEWKLPSGSSAMVVESEKAREGKTINKPLLVRDPKNYKTTIIAKLATDTHVDVIERGENWRKVEVVSGVHVGKIGWISNKYFTLR